MWVGLNWSRNWNSPTSSTRNYVEIGTDALSEQTTRRHANKAGKYTPSQLAMGSFLLYVASMAVPYLIAGKTWPLSQECSSARIFLNNTDVIITGSKPIVDNEDNIYRFSVATFILLVVTNVGCLCHVLWQNIWCDVITSVVASSSIFSVFLQSVAELSCFSDDTAVWLVSRFVLNVISGTLSFFAVASMMCDLRCGRQTSVQNPDV